MCGIVGLFGEWTASREKMFLDMLRLDVLRGPHSTGVLFAGGLDGHFRSAKDVVLPETLIAGKEVQDALKYKWDCYLGHNRWATVGKIIKENAHPFTHDHITGVHNGTLRATYLLGDFHKFDVDSDNLIHEISKQGIEKAWENMNGAAALAFWDNDKQQLLFARNDERPLSYAYVTDRSAIVIASEPWMIRVAASRNGVKMDKVYNCEVNQLYTIDMITVGKKKDKTVVRTNKKPLKKFEAKPYTFHRHYSEWGEDPNDWLAEKGGEGDSPFYDRVDDLVERITRQNGVPVSQTEAGGGEAAKSSTKSVVTIVDAEVLKKVKRFSILIEGDTTTMVPTGWSTSTNGPVKLHYQINGFLQHDRGSKCSAIIPISRRHILEYLPAFGNFSNAFFIGEVVGSDNVNKEYMLDGTTIRPIVPLNAARLITPNVSFTRDAFAHRWKSCAYCGDPLDFTDVQAIFSHDLKHGICGDCVTVALPRDNFTPEQIFSIA